MQQKRVLIADYGNYDSLVGIPHLFRTAGCAVDIYSRKESWLLENKYISDHFLAPDDPSSYAAGLGALAESGRYDWIVLGDDFAARFVARHIRDDALFSKLAQLIKPENRQLLGSKAGLSLLCSEYGIPTPAYAFLWEGADSALCAEKVSFPLLLKVDESAGGSGVFRCENPEELSAVLLRIEEADKENLVLQKYIVGENIAVEALYKRGALVTYAYSIVTKTLRGEFGVSSERRYVPRPEIEERLGRIGEAFGLHGFSSMTFIYDGSEHYLVEADLRPQAWCPLAVLAGTDFSLGIREFLSDEPAFLRPLFLSGKKEIVLRHFPRDIFWYLERKKYLGFWLWLRNAEGRWYVISWHDARLLRRTLFRGVRYLSRRFLRRVRRELRRI